MSKHRSSEIFAAPDLRTYLRSWAKSRGRGEYRRIALRIGMHTTLLSQILSGRKSFTDEQANRLSAYLGLNTLEGDFLLKLVQWERAGTEDLKRIYERHLTELRRQSQEIRHHVPVGKELGEKDRALFYSSWQYGVIRLLTGIEGFQTPAAIAHRLHLPLRRVREVLEFLISRGLCVRHADGIYTRTDRNTHVEATSPLSIRHHQNWRAKSVGLLEELTAEDLAFTAPVSISRQDIPKIRALLVEAVGQIAKVIEKSPSEEVAYLGVDWVTLR